MWWGGGDPEEQTRTPDEEVMEILSEEDARSTPQPGDPDPDSGSLDPDDEDLKSLKDNFAQQQNLLGQLKGVLKSNEQKLVNKEKEVQEYAAKLLGKSKGRSLAASADVLMESAPAGTGKIRLLRKQLEDAKMKEQEELDKVRDLEMLVRDLQKEVEDRDKVITQMREDQFSIASFQASPPSSPFVISPQSRSPTNISPTLGRSFDSSMSFDDFATRSFTEKDEKILELQERNIDLEKKVLELQDASSAKDELIRARTEAVTLMSADFSAKEKNILDQLEETRKEMKEMQKRFTEHESSWREKNSLLNLDLESSVDKLNHLQNDMDHLQNLNCDLRQKNSELQEKISNLQTSLAETKKEKRNLVERYDDDKWNWDKAREELLKDLESAKKDKSTKNELFLEELRELCCDADFADKIGELKNKITELEEEKGSLQLKLVEYEDMKGHVSVEEHRCVKQSLDNQIESLDQLKIHVTEVEMENSKYTEALSDRDNQVAKLSSKISELLSSQDELSRSKVSLEMRSLELEEQRDHWQGEKEGLLQRIRTLEERLAEKLEPVTALEEKLAAVEAEHSSLIHIHSDYKKMFKQNEKELIEKSELLNQGKIEMAELEKLLLNKNVEIGDGISRLKEQSSHMDKLQGELELMTKEKEEVIQQNLALQQNIEDLSSDSKILKLQSNLDQLYEELSEVKMNLELKTNEIEDLNGNLKSKSIEIQQNCELMTAKENELGQVRSELEQSRKVEEGLSGELLELKNSFASQKEYLEGETSHKSGIIQDLQRQIEEISHKSGIIEDLQLQVEGKQNEIKSLEEALSSHQNQIEDLMREIKEKSKEQSEYLTKTDEASKNIIELENKNSELQQVIDSITKEQENRIKEFEEVVIQKEEKCSQNEEVLNELKAKFEAKQIEMKNHIQQLEIRLDEEAKRLEQVEDSQLEGSTCDLNQLEHEMQLLRKEKVKLEEELKENILQRERAESTLTESLNEMSTYRDKMQANEQAIENSEKEKIVLVQQLNELSLQIGQKSIANEQEQLQKIENEEILSEKQQKIHTLESLVQSQEHDLKELERSLSASVVEVNHLKTTLEVKERTLEEFDKQKILLKNLQENYNSLLHSQGDQSELIKERDKLKNKSDLLTEKCKKLLVKCRQQESLMKSHNQQIEELQTSLESSKQSLDVEAKKVLDLEGSLQEIRLVLSVKDKEIDDLQSNLRQLENTEQVLKDKQQELEQSLDKNRVLSESLTDKEEVIEKLQEQVEKWQSEAMEKNSENCSASDEIQTLTEKNANLESSVTSLTNERTKFYEDQAILKDELAEVSKERSRLSKALEDSRNELKLIRESNIVSQMLESHLLKENPSTSDLDTASSINVEVGSTVKYEEEFKGFDEELEGKEGWEVNDWDDENESAFDTSSQHQLPEVILETQNESQPTPDASNDGWGDWGEDFADSAIKKVEEESRANFELGPDSKIPSSVGVKAELEADVEDGWGDDGWSGAWEGQEDPEIGANLKLSEDDGLRSGSEAREISVETEVSKRSTSSPQEIDFQAKIQEKDSYIESLQSEIASMKQKVSQMEDNLRLKEELADQMRIKVADLSQNLEQSEKQMKKLSEETERRSHDLESEKLSTSTCMEKLSISDEMIEDYRKRIEDLSDEQKSLQLELMTSYEELEVLRPLKKAEVQLGEAREKIVSLETYQDELQSENSKIKDSLHLVETELSNVNEQLEAMEFEITDLKDSLKKSNSRRNSLDGHVDEMRSNLVENVKIVDSLRFRNEELEANFASLTSRNEELSKDLDEREKEIAILQDKVCDLQATVDKDDDNNIEMGLHEEDLRLKTDELQMEIAELQKRLQFKDDELQQSCENEGKHLKQVEHLNMEIAALQQRITCLEEQNGQAVELQQQVGALQQLLIDRDNQIQQIQPENVPLQVPNQPLDLDQSNRPPPDITNQHQQHQPDVASHHQGSTPNQPDIMPNFPTGIESVDLVQPHDNTMNVQEAFERIEQQPEVGDLASHFFNAGSSQESGSIASYFGQAEASGHQVFSVDQAQPQEPLLQEEQFAQNVSKAPEPEEIPEQPAPGESLPAHDEAQVSADAQLATELEAYKRALTEWQAWSDKQDQTIQEYMTSHYQAMDQVKTLEQKVAELAQDQIVQAEAYSQARTEIAELQKKIEELEASQGDEQEFIKLQDLIKTKELEINDLNETIDRIKCDRDELESEVEELTRANENLRIETEHQDNQVDIAQYDEVRIQLDEVKEAEEKLSKDLAACQNEHQTLTEAKEELAESYRKISDDFAALTDEKLSLEQKILELQTDLQASEAERSQMSVQIQSLNSQLQEILAAKSDLEDKLRETKESAEIEEKQQKLESELKEQIENLEKELANAKDSASKIGQYEEVIGQWQVWAESQKQEFAGLQESQQQYIDAYNATNETLTQVQEDLGQKEVENEELRSNIKVLDSVKTELGQEIAHLKIELEDKSKLTSVQAELEQMTSEYRAQLQQVHELTEEIDRLKEASEEVDPEKEKLSVRLTLLSNKYTELEANHSKLQVSLKDAYTSVTQLTKEKEGFIQEASESAIQLQKESEAVKLLETENQRLRGDCESLKLRLDVLENEKHLISDSSTTQDYAQFREINQHLQNEIQGLRSFIEQQSLQAKSSESPQGRRSSSLEQSLILQLEQDLQTKDIALQKAEDENELLRRQMTMPTSSPERTESRSSNPELASFFGETPEAKLFSENDRLKQDLDKSVRENKHLTRQMENWKQQLADASQNEEDFDQESDDENPYILKSRQEQAWRSVGALQLRVEELTLEVTKLLEERDTLQLKLSNVMRQYERQKETSSRASTACSTPIPWVDNTFEIKELKAKIEELSKLNYTKDVELQKQRVQMDAMQVRIRHHSTATPTSSPLKTPGSLQHSTSRTASQSSERSAVGGPVLHL